MPEVRGKSWDEYWVDSDKNKGLFELLAKFYRRCVIFWPPKYGLSVITLTSFLFVVNKLRREPLVLYPDEVSRFSTKEWVRHLAAPANLQIQKAHFGVRDLFTYVILVATRS